jgi:hypothetical protein
MRVVVGVVALLSAIGCSGPELKDNHFENSHVRYEITPPGEGWTPLKLETANAAWHNSSLNASLLVNSHCEGVADSPLEGLTSDLLMGMTDRAIEKQEVKPWAKREAMESTATGKLDGVARKLQLFVLKKDGCVYDIVLDADPATFDRARTAFDHVRDGFNVGGRVDHPSEGAAE